MKKKKNNEIVVYDSHETTSFIDESKKLQLKDLNITLPDEPPTKVLSIRIPTTLLNTIKAYAGNQDISYSAMIKLLLAESMERRQHLSAQKR